MKITLSPTAGFVLIEEKVPARVWEGTSETGVPVRAFVLGLQVPEGVDFREFDAALIEVPVKSDGDGFTIGEPR